MKQRKKKSVVAWIDCDIKHLKFNCTLDDYKYQLYGIYKYKQKWTPTKVKITIEEL